MEKNEFAAPHFVCYYSTGASHATIGRIVGRIKARTCPSCQLAPGSSTRGRDRGRDIVATIFHLWSRAEKSKWKLNVTRKHYSQLSESPYPSGGAPTYGLSESTKMGAKMGHTGEKPCKYPKGYVE